MTGEAGTGKTVALLHRAGRLADSPPHLAEEPAADAPRVLVTTFTNKLRDDLVDRLRALGGSELLDRIEVTTVDALAHRTVARATFRQYQRRRWPIRAPTRSSTPRTSSASGACSTWRRRGRGKRSRCHGWGSRRACLSADRK